MSTEGKINQAAGAVKEGVGKLVGDKGLESEGAAEKVASKVKEVAEDAKDAIEGVAEDAKDAIEGAVEGVKNIFKKDDAK